MKYRAIALIMTAGVMTMGAAAFAQPKGAPKASEPAKQASFADDEMSQLAAVLTGSWKCSTVPGAGGGNAEVVMSVAPVATKDMGTVLYAELARGEALNRPFRQAMWQMHRVNGKLRLKTLEFRRPRGELQSAAGLWAAPDAFPQVGQDDLVATLDMELTKDGKGWTGHTLHSYPTTMGGAVEMTSQFDITPDTFTTADRGFDASGKKVWGPDEKAGGLEFKKFDSGVKAQHLDGGLVVVDYPAKVTGEANPKPGDKIVMHYTGYLADGWMFDSSYERALPFTYTVGGKYTFVSEGWRRALADAKKGMQRKLVIPGPLGFGEAGELRGKIPANATLYMDVEVLDVMPGAPNAVGMAPGGPAGMKPIDPNSPEGQKLQAMLKQKQAEAAAAKGATLPSTGAAPPKK